MTAFQRRPVKKHDAGLTMTGAVAVHTEAGWLYNARPNVDRCISLLTSLFTSCPENPLRYCDRGMPSGRRGAVRSLLAIFLLSWRLGPDGPANYAHCCTHSGLRFLYKWRNDYFCRKVAQAAAVSTSHGVHRTLVVSRCFVLQQCVGCQRQVGYTST